MKRDYVLNGKPIDSRDVAVILHRARKDKDESCASCLEPILANTEYFRLNSFNGYLLHKECYLRDHLINPDSYVIAVVRTETYYDFGIKRTLVICKKITSS